MNVFGRITAVSLLTLGFSCLAVRAVAQTETCPSTPEQAVLGFIKSSTENAPRTIEFVDPESLREFRGRLQQLMDDRFSPDSGRFREQIMGGDGSWNKVVAASDAELIGTYMRYGEDTRKGWHVKDAPVIESKRGFVGTWDISASFTVETPEKSVDLSRDFHALKTGNCWTVSYPEEMWLQLERVAKALKTSRTDTGVSRQGESRARLRVSAGNAQAQPGMRRVPRHGQTSPVWVASEPLLTEKDLQKVLAAWDCPVGGFGTEAPALWLTFSDASGDKLRAWTESNMGSMLAIEVNSEVVQFARVAGVFGARFEVCLDGQSLEQARDLAADLMGAPRDAPIPR